MNNILFCYVYVFNTATDDMTTRRPHHSCLVHRPLTPALMHYWLRHYWRALSPLTSNQAAQVYFLYTVIGNPHRFIVHCRYRILVQKVYHCTCDKSCSVGWSL